MTEKTAERLFLGFCGLVCFCDLWPVWLTPYLIYEATR